MHKHGLKSLLLIAAMAVSACGFHPVYGVNKYTPIGAETKFQQINIENIPDREGQYLRNALIDRLYRDGRPSSTRYTLNIAPIRETQRDLDVTIDSDTTRAQLRIDTRMQLTDTQTKETVIDRALNSTASYNVLGSEFTNRVSEQSTRENILDDLARQIEMQLGLYFKKDI
jgi:LPS-assembly lipoprotein